MGFEKKAIGQMLDSIIDYRGKTPPKSDAGIPCISAANVKNGRLVMSNPSYVSRETYDSWTTRGFPKPGDVIITTEAPAGEVAALPGDQTYLLTRRVMALQPNAKELDERFLLYALQTNFIKEDLYAVARGTTVPRVLKTDITDLEIPLPPLPEQKAIAHILGTLDDKIELNRRMNATLEGMAQALFKSWFVDFDPVIDNALAAGNPIPDELAPRAEDRKKAHESNQTSLSAEASAKAGFPAAFQFTDELGWIPEGWEQTTLSELLEVKYGKDHKKLADGEFPVYGSGGLMRHAESALYKGESVLIPRKGTLSNILYLNEEFWTVDTMFYTIPKMGSVAKFCYYHLKGLDFTSMNVGSAVPSMTTKVLNNLAIAKASDHVLGQFDALIGTYFRRSEQNDQESQTLTKLRDTLLPKLISGELSAYAPKFPTE